MTRDIDYQCNYWTATLDIDFQFNHCMMTHDIDYQCTYCTTTCDIENQFDQCWGKQSQEDLVKCTLSILKIVHLNVKKMKGL